MERTGVWRLEFLAVLDTRRVQGQSGIEQQAWNHGRRVRLKVYPSLGVIGPHLQGRDPRARFVHRDDDGRVNIRHIEV